MKCNFLKYGKLTIVRCFLGMLLVVLPGRMVAQGLDVVSSMVLSSRQEAVTYERNDINGQRCALVIMQFDDDNVYFEGDVFQSQYRNNGEWWIWMIHGANWLTIKSPKYTPLRMEFSPLVSGKTYEVRISPAIPNLLLTVTEPFHADITMTDASKFSRLDSQGQTCALVRIGMVLPEAEFSGTVHSVYRDGEWWVWLSPGSRSFTVIAQGYQSLTVQFDPVQASVTYLMTVRKTGETVTQKQQTAIQTADLGMQREYPRVISPSVKRTPWLGISLGAGSYSPTWSKEFISLVEPTGLSVQEVADMFEIPLENLFMASLLCDVAFSVKGKSSFGPFVGLLQMAGYTLIQ